MPPVKRTADAADDWQPRAKRVDLHDECTRASRLFESAETMQRVALCHFCLASAAHTRRLIRAAGATCNFCTKNVCFAPTPTAGKFFALTSFAKPFFNAFRTIRPKSIRMLRVRVHTPTTLHY